MWTFPSGTAATVSIFDSTTCHALSTQQVSPLTGKDLHKPAKIHRWQPPKTRTQARQKTKEEILKLFQQMQLDVKKTLSLVEKTEGNAIPADWNFVGDWEVWLFRLIFCQWCCRPAWWVNFLILG